MRRSVEDVRYELAQACLGRENHADLFSVRTVRLGNRIGITWQDSFTGQRGWIGGLLSDSEVAPVVEAVLTQLRAWRERCHPDRVTTQQAKGVGA